MLNWRCSNIFSIKNNAREEIIEKKSRFIGSVYLIKDKKEAEEIIANVKKEFWDARHNVYAYILPDNICKYSDDGEPQGTAGLPVFNVLTKKNLQNANKCVNIMLTFEKTYCIMTRNRGVFPQYRFYFERKIVMKKVISIVIAIALVLSMSVCAFAAEKPIYKPSSVTAIPLALLKRIAAFEESFE